MPRDVSKLPDLLTISQAAKLLKVTPAQVRFYVREKMLAGQMFGRTCVVRRADVEQFDRPAIGRPKKESR